MKAPGDEERGRVAERILRAIGSLSAQPPGSMTPVIDLDRYPELDPDDLPGPASTRRRPGARMLVVAALALLAAAPAAPPRAISLARAMPTRSICRGDVHMQRMVILGDGTALPGPVTVFREEACAPGDIGRVVVFAGP
ncbi:hypothetical protein [Dactylosporangium sp. NPDC048998]|uniref:hypothetical protein n=1 Tax=Dactylosporangium sp. NPDC048998 TaxID=3363976 RepID=UPI00371940A8